MGTDLGSSVKGRKSFKELQTTYNQTENMWQKTSLRAWVSQSYRAEKKFCMLAKEQKNL